MHYQPILSAETGTISGVEALVRWHPSCLTLELTETALLGDSIEAAARLRELRKLGVRLAVDDFGTGFSSLSQLRKLRVDIQGIVRLAHTLGSRPAAGLWLAGERCRLAPVALASRRRD